MADLPERDERRPNSEQGLYRKFEVYRTDREDAGPDCKHWNCDYFVIDVTHDQHARAALAAYADACETTHPQLAADMRARYSLPTHGVSEGQDQVRTPRGTDGGTP